MMALAPASASVAGACEAQAAADFRRNVCPRGERGCAWDTVARACVAEGCALSDRPVAEGEVVACTLCRGMGVMNSKRACPKCGKTHDQWRAEGQGAARPESSPAADAMRWLNQIELYQGGSNGPTIRLRDAIRALTDTLEYEWDGLFKSEIVELNAAHLEILRLAIAEAALARQAPAPLSQAVPAGFWLAPMEPDSAMLKALRRHLTLDGWRDARDSWLARHPQPQAVPEDARDGERERGRMALQALHYWHTEYTGREPSESVFARMAMEALCGPIPDAHALQAEINDLRYLLDTRPAMNAGLAEAYAEWTAKVYIAEHSRADAARAATSGSEGEGRG